MTVHLNEFHRWWLDRFTRDEILELAKALGGPIRLSPADRERARWARAAREQRARRAERRRAAT